MEKLVNPRVLWKTGNLFTSWATVSFSGSNVFRVVSLWVDWLVGRSVGRLHAL